MCNLCDFPEVQKDSRLLVALLMEQVKGICLSREKHLWAELSGKCKYFKSNTEGSESKHRLAVQAAREGIYCAIHQRPT